MRVTASDVDAFMTHTFGNGDRREAFLDQEADMAVPQVVDADLLDARGFAAPLHLMGQEVPRDGEEAVGGLQTVQGFHVILHLVAEKSGNLDGSVALGGLGFGHHVAPLDPLVGFVDPQRRTLEVEVRSGECQQFAFTNAAPVEDFKGMEAAQRAAGSRRDQQGRVRGMEAQLAADSR